ncbi:MAG: hypothetical protein DWI02_07780 [Planctomycetota bacterium]|nr:MAG: hypothetical protein DWI02_07780 [Planctomycetota bacterium]
MRVPCILVRRLFWKLSCRVLGGETRFCLNETKQLAELQSSAKIHGLHIIRSLNVCSFRPDLMFFM